MHLRIELDVGSSKANKAREERLVQVGELLECHVLHHRWQLIVVPNQGNTLQPASAVLNSL